MKTIRLLLFVLLLTLPTLACGLSRSEPTPEPTAEVTAAPTALLTAAPTPDLTANFVPFNDEFNGVSLSIPPDWVTESFFFTLLATDEQIVEDFFSGNAPDAPPDGAVMFILAGSPDEFSADSLEEALLEALAEMEMFDNESEIVEGPTALRINNQAAATAVAQGITEQGNALTIVAFIIRSDEHNRVAVIIGATLTDNAAQYLPIMRAIAQTAEVGPEGEFPDFGFNFDDPFDAAEFIFLNETAEGMIADEFVEAVVFIFSGAPTVVYDIIVTPLDGLDPLVDLLDEERMSLLPDGIPAGLSGAPEIRGFQPDDFGLFYISVRGFAGSAGRFELELRESQLQTEAEPETEAETGWVWHSGLTGAGHELIASGEVSPNRVDRFVIRSNAGETVTAVVTPQGTFDVVLSLYDSVSEELLLEIDDYFGEETLAYTFLDNGIYYLEVSGYLGTGGAYDIILTVGPQTSLELFAGDFINGWMDDSGLAVYDLQLQMGDQIIVSVKPEPGSDLLIDLLNERLQDVASADDAWEGGAKTLRYNVTETGAYFLRIRDIAGAGGSRYSLTFDLDYGNGATGMSGSFTSDLAGVRMPAPEGWAFTDEQFLVIFASSAERLQMFEDGATAPPNDDALLGFLISADLSEFVANDPAGIIQEAVQDFAILPNPEFILDPTDLWGSPYNAQYAIVTGNMSSGLLLTVMYAALVDESLNQTVVLVASSPTASFSNFTAALLSLLNEIEITGKP